MADRSGPVVFSIPPIRAFADALVAGILVQHGADPLSLARGMALVPNNRAGQAIREAFVRQAERGLLLPRIVALGDMELDEKTGASLDPIDDEPIPPAVEPLRRQLMLARLIQRGKGLDAAEAMRLAGELARTLDQMIVEEVEPSRLRELDMGELSEHWARSLDQLSAILELWPAELARIGCIDLADRRNRQLDRSAERWRMQPPDHFVIAAGISTAAPAVARLMHTISRMPGGQVVLSGVDLDIPAEEWDAIGGSDDRTPLYTHPQFHLHQLLTRMKVARGEVQPWRWAGEIVSTATRASAISQAFAPAEATKRWVELTPAQRNLTGVSVLELASPAEEAQAIAIAVREAVETPGRTVALMTADRDLAARVSAHLKRWGIEADDSAGRKLSATPNGTLLLALATAALERFAPAPLMTLLKHPLVRAGDGRRAWVDGARKLDLALRGPRPAPGLAAIAAHLIAGDDRTRAVREAARSFWSEAQDLLQPMEGRLPAELPDLIGILRETATALAGDAIWAGQEGRALSELIADLEDAGGDGPQVVTMAALPQLLRQLMDGIAIRPGYGGHPRVFIWGLLEARLQSTDLMILGGLNEGTWPQLPSPDPWLAPRIRRELGLPDIERGIGLAAHDLASALGAPAVIMTRAARDARSPTIASRFWLRLETMTGGLPSPDTRHDLLAHGLDASAGPPGRTGRPAPCPPVEERPRKISVTDVDRLSADPFAFYAKTMLRLQPLDPLDADPGPAWRGSMIHEVLRAWAEDDAYASGALVWRIDEALSAETIHPLIRSLWAPRLIEAAGWIEQRVADNRREGRIPGIAEKWGTADFVGITIGGRVDRLDTLADGTIAVIDYKTGEPPSNAQVSAGFAMQLGLIGLIAEAGGFAGAKGKAGAFEYWSLTRGKDGFGKMASPVTGRNPVSAPETFVGEIAKQFAQAAAKWLTGSEPFKAKIAPEYAWGEYDHLMRLEEWQGRDG